MSRYNYIPNFSLDKRPDAIAHWDYDDKNLTVFLRSMKKVFGNKPTDLLINAIVYVIQHEILHGVIQHQLQNDKYNGTFNAEWPMRKGFNNDYMKLKRMMSKRNH